MRKTITFILISTALFTFSGKCHAQFLKKLGKSIEKASKDVDKFLGTENSVSTGSANKITYSTPNKNLQVNLIGGNLNGDSYILEFTITNYGEDIKNYNLMDGASEKTIAFDNLGNQCNATLLFGNVRSKNNGYAGNTLLKGVPVKVVVTITKFGANATYFPQIKIGAGTDIWNITNHFIFKNLPISKEEEHEVVMPARKTKVVNIPKTRGIMSLDDAYDQHDNRKLISSADRASLKIDNIRYSGFDNKWPNNKLSAGKIIYSGELGLIATIFHIEKDHASTEFLVSYDTQGNLVDCISIAYVSTYGGDRGEGTIEGDKVTACFYFSEGGQSGTTYIEYKITPELKFIKIKEWSEDE